MNRRGFIGKALMGIAALPLVRVIAKSEPVSTVSRRANAPRSRPFIVNNDTGELFSPNVRLADYREPIPTDRLQAAITVAYQRGENSG